MTPTEIRRYARSAVYLPQGADLDQGFTVVYHKSMLIVEVRKTAAAGREWTADLAVSHTGAERPPLCQKSTVEETRKGGRARW